MKVHSLKGLEPEGQHRSQGMEKEVEIPIAIELQLNSDFPGS